MPDNERPQSWWHTVPGILTAIATVVTAITGLLLALNQIGVFEGNEKAQAPITGPDDASTSPAKRAPQIPPKTPLDTTAKPTHSPAAPTLPSDTGRESPRTAQMDYDAVQALYSKHKSTYDCTEIRRIVAEISEYAGNQQPVPQDARYSVRFPSTKANPTMADLVTDRITRIRKGKAECFPAKPPVTAAHRPRPDSAPVQVPQPTDVLRSERDQIVGYRWISEGPGLAVFEVDYTYDPAHTQPMYVRVTVLTGRQPLAQGLTAALNVQGRVRVDARKRLERPTTSEYIEVVLMEGNIPVKVVQYPFERRWGP